MGVQRACGPADEISQKRRQRFPRPIGSITAEIPSEEAGYIVSLVYASRFVVEARHAGIGKMLRHNYFSERRRRWQSPGGV